MPSDPIRPEDVVYEKYKDETELPDIMALISHDLSEPYSIYVYRYFIHQWPELCILARYNDDLIGCIINKLEPHRETPLRGYIAMLAVKKEYRGLQIASRLVQRSIDEMVAQDADEIALETEVTNVAAMALYEKLGFVRYKRLHRYYLNASDAIRLLLPLKEPQTPTQVDPGMVEEVGGNGGDMQFV
ncbi:N-alpha-acetyltransferase 30 [Saitoella coloradoensis]